MAKGKLTREEILKRKEAMIKEEGTFVVKGQSLESGAIIRHLNEYDWLVGYIKKRIGRPGIDRDKTLNLIEKCSQFDSAFMALVDELKTFVEEQRKSTLRARQPEEIQNGDTGNNVAQKAGKRKQPAEATP